MRLVLLLKCYFSFKVRLYTRGKEERLHLFYIESIIHVVLFVCPLMAEMSPFGSSAFYCLTSACGKAKVCSQTCVFFFPQCFLAFPVL